MIFGFRPPTACLLGFVLIKRVIETFRSEIGVHFDANSRISRKKIKIKNGFSTFLYYLILSFYKSKFKRKQALNAERRTIGRTTTFCLEQRKI